MDGGEWRMDVTGAPEFKALEKEIKIVWLTGPSSRQIPPV
jgi:hypothetical protein